MSFLKGAPWEFKIFVLSLLFLIKPLKLMTSFVLNYTIYVPVFKVESSLREIVNLKRDRDNWAKLYLSLTPSIQKEALSQLDSIWKSKIYEKHGVLVHALDFDPAGVPLRILIDKGKRHGIKYGEALVYANNFVGKVVQVFPNTAWVNTIYNSNLKIAVADKSNGMIGILQGGPSARVFYIPAWAKVKEGDTLITSGIGKLIPPGLKVGVVEKVDTSKNMPYFLDIKVKPFYEASKSGLFAIVRRVGESDTIKTYTGREK